MSATHRRTLSGRRISRDSVNPGWGDASSVRKKPTLEQTAAALVRFDVAMQDAELEGANPDAELTLPDLIVDEMHRRVVPNRAMRRRAGQRTSFTKRLHVRLAMGADIARADAIDDNPQRKAQDVTRRAVAAARAKRKAERQKLASA
jgi:hypothetical protein